MTRNSAIPGLTGPYMPEKPLAVVVLDLANLLAAVAYQHGVKPEDLTRRDNSAAIVAVRRQFAAEARAKGFSLPEIGRALRRHHTTILNLLNGKGRG